VNRSENCSETAARKPVRRNLLPFPDAAATLVSVPPEASDPAVSSSDDVPDPDDVSSKEAQAVGAGSPAEGDARLRERLSEVYHDLNNSLAVISGNAQLLAELARAEDLGPAFTDPLEDVEAARSDISDALERLDRLRAKTDRQESRPP